MNCTRSKIITSGIQNTCQLQPYGLKVSPCIYATIWDHNQSLLNNTFTSCQIQLLFSCSIVSDSLRPCGLQHARLPCPSLSPGVCSNSYPFSWQCHPTILSSWSPSPPPAFNLSSESSLRIRWPKYWSFSFSISPSKEYSGLSSFRIDWFNLLAVQGTLKSLRQHPI